MSFLWSPLLWVGLAHPPRTSAALAPLAAAAYILPLFFLPGTLGSGLTSAAITIPVCVLVGEGIGWGVGRLEQIELALARERDRAEQLRELDEMKDRFLSAVSHELRTPSPSAGAIWRCWKKEPMRGRCARSRPRA